MNVTPAYILGHADLEIERLQLQADIIAGVTRRLIRECGIGPGMRVLDIGCGVGDVSMLLARRWARLAVSLDSTANPERSRWPGPGHSWPDIEISNLWSRPTMRFRIVLCSMPQSAATSCT